MVARIAAVYFQAYQLAVTLAAQAQRAYQVELNRTDTFVNAAYWDNLHRGLMAEENLAFSLAQMESSYLQNDARTLEIERTISLALWIASALASQGERHLRLRVHRGAVRLRLSRTLQPADQVGNGVGAGCGGPLSEPLLHAPQNYNAVVTQADTMATGTAYLLQLDAAKMSNPNGAPDTVRENWGSGQAIAVSRGVDDSGLFVLDFRDERYLPFEKTGAISSWTLALPKETNRFDVSTITDVIVTLRYTATNAGAGSSFTKALKQQLAAYPYPGALYLSLARAYPTEWRAFVLDRSQPAVQSFTFPLDVGVLGAFKTAPTLNEVDLRPDTIAGVNLRISNSSPSRSPGRRIRAVRSRTEL